LVVEDEAVKKEGIFGDSGFGAILVAFVREGKTTISSALTYARLTRLPLHEPLLC
jgi:hypothetical protein